ALARLTCVVFYMGLRHLAKIAARMSDAGMSPDTPAAVVERLTSSDERVVIGTLANISARAADAGVQAPALIVVREPVRYRARLAPTIADALSTPIRVTHDQPR